MKVLAFDPTIFFPSVSWAVTRKVRCEKADVCSVGLKGVKGLRGANGRQKSFLTYSPPFTMAFIILSGTD